MNDHSVHTDCLYAKTLFRWATRTVQAATSADITSLARDLIVDIQSISDVNNKASIVSVDSWNVAKLEKERELDRHMPVYFLNESHIIFFCSVIRLRQLADNALKIRNKVKDFDKKEFMWTHYLLGETSSKHILVADILGTDNIGNDCKIGSPYSLFETDTNYAKIVHIPINKKWLANLRRKYRRVSDSVWDDVKSYVQKIKPEIDRQNNVYNLEHIRTEIGPLSEKLSTNTIIDATINLVCDIDEAITSDVIKYISELYCISGKDIETRAFLRQMILQAFVCNIPTETAYLVFISDISHYGNQKQAEDVIPSEKIISSLALQLFLKKLPENVTDYEFWTTLISMVGRGKTIHNFSELQRKRALSQGALNLLKGFRYIKHDIRNVVESLNAYTDNPIKILKLMHLINYVVSAAEYHAWAGFEKYDMPPLAYDERSKPGLWRQAGYKGESLTDTLIDSFNKKGFTLVFKGYDLNNLQKPIDPRFVGLITELARNMNKWAREKGIIEIINDCGVCKVLTYSNIREEGPEKCLSNIKKMICNELTSSSVKWNGISIILRFSKDLASDNSFQPDTLFTTEGNYLVFTSPSLNPFIAIK